MNTEKTLMCRRCKVIPKLVKEEGHSDTITCPKCSRSADLKAAIRIASKHAAGGLIDDFRDGLARSVRSSKAVKYIKGNRPNAVTPDFVFD